MKSRKKILAGMVAMALGSGAYAATFEGRLACDQDPREAGTSCMLYVPVTDTVGLPVYTQQISVTHLLEPRGAAAAGMESTPALGEFSARTPMTESFSSEPPKQTSLSNDSSVYPRSEVAEGKPASEIGDRQASASSSRSGLFSWFRTEGGSGISSADSSSRDLASTSLMESDHLAGTEPGSAPERVANSSGRGILSWLTADRSPRTISERSTTIEAQPSSSALSESASVGSTEILASSSSEARSSSRSGVFGWLTAGSADERSRNLASTSLMESDHLAGTEPGEHEQMASAPSQPGLFGRLFGDRGSRSVNEPSAAIKSQDQLATGSSSHAGSPRDFASTSLMESDHLAGTEPNEHPSGS
jgi:hypothetical protein